MTDYTLKADAETMALIARAMEFYARVGMGQLDIINEHPSVRKRLPVIDDNAKANANHHLSGAKYALFGLPGDAYLSIHNRDNPADVMQAFDIKHAIKHRLAWDRVGNPPKRDIVSMSEVDFDDRGPVCMDRPLISIEKV
jgi:hypothetical protein